MLRVVTPERSDRFSIVIQPLAGSAMALHSIFLATMLDSPLFSVTLISVTLYGRTNEQAHGGCTGTRGTRNRAPRSTFRPLRLRPARLAPRRVARRPFLQCIVDLLPRGREVLH